jgi:hypothetical protein
MLNDDEKSVLKATWGDALTLADDVGDLFFERLLALRPAYAVLFLRADMKLEKERFFRAISFVVRSLDWPEDAWLDAASPEDDAVFAAFSLGANGEGIAGIAPDSYPLMGDALVWSLETALGTAFSREAADVWRTVSSGMLLALRLGSTFGEWLAPTRRRPIDRQLAAETDQFSRAFVPDGAPAALALNRRVLTS